MAADGRSLPAEGPGLPGAPRFAALYATAPCALLAVGGDGLITVANAKAEQLLGYAPGELMGLHVDELLPDETDAKPFYDEEHRGTDLHLVARRKDGSELSVEISLTRVDGLTSVVIRDVTERDRAAQTLAHQASHDPLTGLPNRSLFLDRLEHALARTRRSNGRLAVLFLDLDGFKLVNDTHGHDVGDVLLRVLAPRLSGALRPGDTIARLGGDEFVVLCEDLVDEDAALRIAQRLAGACNRPVLIGEEEHLITVSIGIALLPEGGDASASDLLRNADAAMYRAKSNDASAIEVFDDGMRSGLIERIGLEYDLRRALAKGELRVLYQPVVAVHGQAIVGAEALLRWEHPSRGLLELAEFIDVAESSGLIVPIGNWVLEQACHQAAQWNALAPRAPIYVSVNLSRQQVIRSDVASTVARSLRSSGLDPGLLELEISETVLLDQVGACDLVLRGLKALGVRVVLDDFGTGYASLRYLRRLRLDALKIDPSFVTELGRETDDGAVIDAMLSMARALEVRVTAEGVENAAQLSELRQQGCDFVQGYLFSRPEPGDVIAELLVATSAERAVEA